MAPEEALEDLGLVDFVVEDTNKFKLKLGIGEDAYASLKVAKTLQTIWDVKGAAGAGAAVASSSAVATTFFGGGGGLLSAIGLGAAAATPVGWIMAAAVASGGAYYGAMRLASNYSGTRVQSIPKFINTPIDLLGATLFDMVGGIALKVASLSGEIDDTETEALINYFSEEWGISADYMEKAVPVIIPQVQTSRLKDMAKTLAEFQIDNPDCNPTAMRKDISQLLEEITQADGEVDEVEELAVEAVERELGKHLSMQNQALKMAQKTGTAAAEATTSLADSASKQAGFLYNKLKNRLNSE